MQSCTRSTIPSAKERLKGPNFKFVIGKNMCHARVALATSRRVARSYKRSKPYADTLQHMALRDGRPCVPLLYCSYDGRRIIQTP